MIELRVGWVVTRHQPVAVAGGLGLRIGLGKAVRQQEINDLLLRQALEVGGRGGGDRARAGEQQHSGQRPAPLPAHGAAPGVAR